MRFRATIYLDVGVLRRSVIHGRLVASLAPFARLEPEVTETDEGLEVALTVDADDATTASTKARYWCERASRRDKVLNWTGKTTKPDHVEPV